METAKWGARTRQHISSERTDTGEQLEQTAKALGVTVPQSMLMRADELIQLAHSGPRPGALGQGAGALCRVFG